MISANPVSNGAHELSAGRGDCDSANPENVMTALKLLLQRVLRSPGFVPTTAFMGGLLTYLAIVEGVSCPYRALTRLVSSSRPHRWLIGLLSQLRQRALATSSPIPRALEHATPPQPKEAEMTHCIGRPKIQLGIPHSTGRVDTYACHKCVTGVVEYRDGNLVLLKDGRAYCKSSRAEFLATHRSVVCPNIADLFDDDDIIIGRGPTAGDIADSHGGKQLVESSPPKQRSYETVIVANRSWLTGCTEEYKVCLELVHYLKTHIVFRTRTVALTQLLREKARLWCKEKEMPIDLQAALIPTSVAHAELLSDEELQALRIQTGLKARKAYKMMSEYDRGVIKSDLGYLEAFKLQLGYIYQGWVASKPV